MTSALALAVALALARSPETAASREQARLCEKLTGEESLAACRRAIELGLSPERLEPVRQIVARRLASLERWPELADHFRGDVALRPLDAGAHLRLGSTLLFAVGEPAEAEAELTEAVRLEPDSAVARGLLALALAARGRLQEAADAFDAATSLDEHLLDHRPAMRAAIEAARRGEAWP